MPEPAIKPAWRIRSDLMLSKVARLCVAYRIVPKAIRVTARMAT
jgi:hypothetical protein